MPNHPLSVFSTTSTAGWTASTAATASALKASTASDKEMEEKTSVNEEGSTIKDREVLGREANLDGAKASATQTKARSVVACVNFMFSKLK